MTFTRIDVTPDTPEWLEERRKSIGASEVAAVMGLSQYSTALDVYKSKLGIAPEFDPLLSFVGHESEPIIHKWVEQFSGLNVNLEPGFMARSVEMPWLHASFDRTTTDPWLTYQFKTAHQYTSHHWDEGIPVEYRVQVQAEMFVAGTQKSPVVVWIGGREFRLFWEPRDDVFIHEHMLPAVDEFWQRVLERRMPDPQTTSEIAEVYPTAAGTSVNLSAEAFDVLERITVLRADLKAQEDECKALQVTLSKYVEGAELLTFNGSPVATWKTQAGKRSFDHDAFEVAHPRLAAQFTTQGAPYKVLRRTGKKK